MFTFDRELRESEERLSLRISPMIANNDSELDQFDNLATPSFPNKMDEANLSHNTNKQSEIESFVLLDTKDAPNTQDGQEADLKQSLLSDEKYMLHTYQINFGK